MGGKGRGYAVASSRLIGLLAARSRMSDTWAAYSFSRSPLVCYVIRVPVKITIERQQQQLQSQLPGIGLFFGFCHLKFACWQRDRRRRRRLSLFSRCCHPSRPTDPVSALL